MEEIESAPALWMWDYLRRYDDNIEANEHVVNLMIDRALEYYRDFILPTKKYELPPDEMLPAVRAFREFLAGNEGDDAKEIVQ